MAEIKKSNDEIIQMCKEILNNEDYKGYELQYVIKNRDEQDNVIAIATKGDEMIEFNPFENEINSVPDWMYDFDNDFLNELEWNKEIIYMTMDWHHNSWLQIDSYAPEDMEHKEGMQAYLKYCKEHNIDKNVIEKEANTTDVPDVMKLYNELEVGSIIEYKGYIIEVNDYNSENDKENIVYIYESKQDHIDGEYIESVSLNSAELEQNIKDYIDDNYSNNETDKNYIQIENGQVKMSKEMYQKENEIHYIAFCLGYDLINSTFNNSEVKECDIAYDFCDYLAKKFIETDYYKNEKHSTYEMLQEWVNDNKDIIQSEYLYFAEIDNKKIIEVGKRNNTPIALVEHHFKDGKKEYIIAVHYEVNDKKVNWGYGHYYSNNLEKAKNDFERAKAGESLSDTFKANKPKHKERER